MVVAEGVYEVRRQREYRRPDVRSGWPTDGGPAELRGAAGAGSARAAAAADEGRGGALAPPVGDRRGDRQLHLGGRSRGGVRARATSEPRPHRLGALGRRGRGGGSRSGRPTRRSRIRIGSWSVARIHSSPRWCGSPAPRSGAAGASTARAARIARWRESYRARARPGQRLPARARRGRRAGDRPRRQAAARAVRAATKRAATGGRTFAGITSGRRLSARSSRPATALPCSSRWCAPGSPGLYCFWVTESPRWRGGASSSSSLAPRCTSTTGGCTAPTVRPSSGGTASPTGSGKASTSRAGSPPRAASRLGCRCSSAPPTSNAAGSCSTGSATSASSSSPTPSSPSKTTTASSGAPDPPVDGEPLTVVEVVNSTPEPDGSHRRYFLRVPPDTRTAREAVAWTFGFDDPHQYAITAES